MVVLAGAENLITLFVGIELLSIPLYVLCATRAEARDLARGRAQVPDHRLGGLGDAALRPRADLRRHRRDRFAEIASAVGNPDKVGLGDPLLLTGVALTATGLAFKASVAPFHQWTPDVYQGAPDPDHELYGGRHQGRRVRDLPASLRHRARQLAGRLGRPPSRRSPSTTIIVGNVGAIAQRSLKRMLAWSGVAQAGYLLAGVVVGTELGVRATVFYLAVYLLMNVTAFAVVIARERVSEHGDDLRSLEDLGRASPWLAWPMTIAMLALAGFPATGGFIGKFYLIDAAVSGDYTVLGIAIVVGSMISLAYYLRVIAVMWLGRVEVDLPTTPPRRVKPVGGWSPEADARAQPEVLFVAVICAAAVIFFGIWPDPLFDAARDVGAALSGLG